MPVYQFANFREYWEHLDMRERPLLARLSGVSYQMLWGMANGQKMAGHLTMAKLGKVDKRITPRLLRPDLYGKKVYLRQKNTTKHGLPAPKPATVRKARQAKAREQAGE